MSGGPSWDNRVTTKHRFAEGSNDDAPCVTCGGFRFDDIHNERDIDPLTEPF